jgi:hypothetical protein
MSRRTVFHVCYLFVGMLAVAEASGAEAKLNRVAINVPERGEVLAYAVSVGTNHFQFMPPPQWRVGNAPGGKVVIIISPDLAVSMAIDFLEGPTVRGRQKNRHEKLIVERYPASRSRDRFAARTGLGEGPASDIEREAADGSKVISRVIHARAGSAVVEFMLTAPAKKFSESTALFAGLVNSFQPATSESK